MSGETINLAEVVGDLRLLKDKVAALEKTNAALASALTRTVQQAIEKTDAKFEREMKLISEHVAERANSIGEAIDSRFGEAIAKMKADIEKLAGTAQRSAEASAKSAEVADLFERKLGTLDACIKGMGDRLDATRATYLDEEDGKLIKSRLDAVENAYKKPAQVRR